MQLQHVTNLHPSVDTSKESSLLVCNKTRIGIEIELEGVPDSNYNFTLWSTTNDHSLRGNGLELITPPIHGDSVIEALKELDSFVHSRPHEPLITERTGVHIHVDVRGFSVVSLHKLIVLYVIFEDLFFRHCSSSRIHSPYCIPISECDSLLTSISNAITSEDRRALELLFANYPKYSALNLRPIMYQGSIEFRAHEGTIDTASIMQWINLILCIKDYAVTSTRTIQTIIDMTCGDLQLLLSEVFNDTLTTTLTSDITRGIQSGARIAQETLYVTPRLSGLRIPTSVKELKASLLFKLRKEEVQAYITTLQEQDVVRATSAIDPITFRS